MDEQVTENPHEEDGKEYPEKRPFLTTAHLFLSAGFEGSWVQGF